MIICHEALAGAAELLTANDSVSRRSRDGTLSLQTCKYWLCCKIRTPAAHLSSALTWAEHIASVAGGACLEASNSLRGVLQLITLIMMNGVIFVQGPGMA